MVKELKIAKLPKALTALMLFALTSSSLAAEANLKELLATPGVAEQLQANYGGKSTYDGQQDTPLVTQAKKFALRINPPPPPEAPKPKATSTNQPIRPQATVSAKFKLLGTSYHFGDQSKSWSLIDEVGKGLHWVRQGDTVGHLIIEKIGDGAVLINDNGRKYELLADRQGKPDVVKSYTGTLLETEPIVLLAGGNKVTGSAESVELPAAATAQQEPQQPVVVELTPEEQLKNAQAGIEWIKQIQQDPNSAGMSAAEVNDLGGLGDLLKTLETEAQQLQTASSTDSNVPAQENAENVQPPKVVPQPKVEENNPDRVKPRNSTSDEPVKSTTDPVKLRKIRARR